MTAPNNTTDAHREIEALRGELRDLEQQARTASPNTATVLHERAVRLARQYRELAL